MTYAVALNLERGLVFASDTRTNAGFDNIAQYRKMQIWRKPGNRVFVLLSAGNLAVTQTVVNLLNERLDDEESSVPNLYNAANMYRAARIVGDAIREARRIDGAALEAARVGFNTHFIFGGQIEGEKPRLFQVYPEGNFIESTSDTPFFQIGEHKYGKPILDRVARADMRLGEAAKIVLLSFDSTLRSNLSVGMPIDLVTIQRDRLTVDHRRRFDEKDPYMTSLRKSWGEGVRQAFAQLPNPDWN